MTWPAVTVVVLAFGQEALLEACVRAALDSDRCRVDVVVVDNGAPPERVAAVERLDGVRVLRPGRNTGFAGGCVLAAAAAGGEILVLLNSDAVVRPGALGALADALQDPGVGLACASVRLATDEDTINTSGNPLHYTGLSWAGGHGRPAAGFTVPRDVTIAAGTCLATRRETWEALGGLWPTYFAYHEDVDLSWRTWQAGLRCVYVPTAVVVHHYEFARHRAKNYLLERNRLLFLLVSFERRTLVRFLPALALVEVGVLLLALRERWLTDKLAGYRWLVANRRVVLDRRGWVQDQRRIPDDALLPLLSSRLDPGMVALTPLMRVLDRLLDLYWRTGGRPGSLRRRRTSARPRS